jgi:hypothetical protein
MLVNFLLNEKLNYQKILPQVNIASLFVSFYGSCIAFSNIDIASNYDAIWLFFTLYFFFDLWFLPNYKKDVIFHHLFFLFSMYYMKWRNNWFLHEYITRHILKTELSSVFLSMLHLYPRKVDNMISFIIQVCFVSSFIHYRIIMNIVILFSLYQYEMLEEFIVFFPTVFLNLFWLIRIINAVYQTIILRKKYEIN